MGLRPTYSDTWERWKSYMDLPWWKQKQNIGGCYGVILKFYEEQYDIPLYDYPSEKKYYFKTDYIHAAAPGGSTVIYQGNNMESFDHHIMKEGDVMIMRLYIAPLKGGYRNAEGHRLANHIGIYLEGGYMLHHPYQCNSTLVDLESDGKMYLSYTELVLRKKENTI